MTDDYKEIFSAIGEYISGAVENGYDIEKTAGILKKIKKSVDSPLSVLRKALELNGMESLITVLGLLAAVSRSFSAKISELCHAPSGCITPQICCELFVGTRDIFDASDVFSTDGALARIFEGVQPKFCAVMSMRNDIISFLTTGELYDECFVPETKEIVAGGGIAVCDSAVEQISMALSAKHMVPAVIQVCGEVGTGRRTSVRRAFSKTGISYTELMLDNETLGPKPLAERLKELSTKLFLLNSVPVIFRGGTFSHEEFCRSAGILSRENGICVAVTDEPVPDDSVPGDIVTVKTGFPTMEEQYRLWERESAVYNVAPGVDLSEITGEFSLSVGAIKKAFRYADMFSAGRQIDAAMIKEGCYRSVNSDMGSKAVKINCVFGWDDIVLPENSKKLMRAACDQVRLRHRIYEEWGFSSRVPYGRSVAMIFTGPPGTGKTMGAQIIASQLGLDIYKVDLANVVSKYIGETEKNLGEIFEKARKRRVVLFIDEADVLFSKRTEVKDSNDKYSNMESAFLLQKIEEYNGIVILATNLVQNFDEAFKRRMKFLIDFPFPDAQRRREMWKKVFPPEVPLGEIDLDFMVENFELSGSNIKNIALHSAFLAAADGEPVG
ncbi:MAG: ATP-binding protein, partial [Ruminiclostridium sp.]|nr:ATP-binding protein [Ruminiclostridium sp.]